MDNKVMEELMPQIDKVMREFETLGGIKLTDREEGIMGYTLLFSMMLVQEAVAKLSCVPDTFKGSDDA